MAWLGVLDTLRDGAPVEAVRAQAEALPAAERVLSFGDERTEIRSLVDLSWAWPAEDAMHLSDDVLRLVAHVVASPGDLVDVERLPSVLRWTVIPPTGRHPGRTLGWIWGDLREVVFDRTVLPRGRPLVKRALAQPLTHLRNLGAASDAGWSALPGSAAASSLVCADLGHHAGTRLVHALSEAELPCLRDLRIPKAALNIGAVRALARSGWWPRVRILELSEADLPGDATHALIDLVAQSRLEELDLGGVTLPIADLVRQVPPTLKHLRVRDTPSDAGARVITVAQNGPILDLTGSATAELPTSPWWTFLPPERWPAQW